jgi:ubiquinone/menaquinone biosynthesis C-methylase UbiE
MRFLGLNDGRQSMSQPDQQSFWGDTSYLDAVSAMSAAQAYKRRTFELLDAQPGTKILDVGCGPGDDVLALAELVGADGGVVGVDVRTEMIAEARSRAARRDLPVEFQIGSAYQLDFADETFDGCRADRVFQHLDRPQKALAEMVRVTRSGGRVVVFDADWEMLVIDSPHRAVTRKILNYDCDIRANGWAGRALLRLFRASGLQYIAVEQSAGIVTDFATANYAFGLQEMAETAQAAEIISDEERRLWLEYLEQAGREGLFFSAVTGFIVCGRKPQ